MFGRKDEMLPLTGGGGPRNPSLFDRLKRSIQPDANDGSARSIHLTPPVIKWWNRSSTSVKRTYQAALLCLVLFYIGYRTIRYQNAYIHVTCHSTACFVRIQPIGWTRAVDLQVAREQVLNALAIKTQQDGTFVTDQGVTTDDYQRHNQKQGKKKNKKSSNYKGPDENGEYISYAIYLRDKSRIIEPEDLPFRQAKEQEPPVKVVGEDEPLPVVSLAPIHQYLHPTDELGEFRLILRQFRMAQSRRRVRTILQKITSYIKHRRQKLVLKENSPPSWQGILMTVVGLIGFLLSLLLGQIWDEDDIVKAKRDHKNKKKQQQQGLGTRRKQAPPQKNDPTQYPASGRTRKRVTSSYQ
jgi:hypothetical protein